MQAFILWQKIEPPYIYGILSNFKKVQIGYLDSYGNKVYYASYYDYEDIADDYEPEQEPKSGEQFTGAEWNRKQQRKYYKNLRENLNNSNNPEYTRPPHLANDIQFTPLQQHSSNTTKWTANKISQFENTVRENAQRITGGASNFLGHTQQLNSSPAKNITSLLSFLSDNSPQSQTPKVLLKKALENNLHKSRLYNNIDKILSPFGLMVNSPSNNIGLDNLFNNEIPKSDILSIEVREKLKQQALSATNIQGVIKRGETVLLRQYLKVQMYHREEGQPPFEIYETPYFVIYKGEEGKTIYYFVQSGQINQKGEPVGHLILAELEYYYPYNILIEKLPIFSEPIRMHTNTEMQVLQAIKIPPLPPVQFDFPIKITFINSSDQIDYNVTPQTQINDELAEIATRLNSDLNLIITIFGDTTNKSNIQINMSINGRRQSRLTSTLMNARANHIRQILIRQYGVRPSQVRTRLGNYNAATYGIRAIFQRR